MVAIVPPLVMILLLALIFYLARREAYRDKDKKEGALKRVTEFVRNRRK